MVYCQKIVVICNFQEELQIEKPPAAQAETQRPGGCFEVYIQLPRRMGDAPKGRGDGFGKNTIVILISRFPGGFPYR